MNYSTNNHQKNHRMIAFIDAEVVKNIKNTMGDLVPRTELVVIDSARDGIEQITEILAERRNIRSLQILASVNGNEGSLKIGLTQLNIHTLEAYIDDLHQWKNALSDTSEILLYGCLVLVESIFQNFIYQLSKITGADIGAFVTFSDGLTANNEERDCSATQLLLHPTKRRKPEHESNHYSLMVAWRS